VRAEPQGLDANGLPVPFRQVIGRPHRAYAFAELTDPQGNVATLAITGGSVSVNRGAAVRRSCTLSVSPGEGGSAIPAGARSPLAPFGSTVALWYGIDVPGVPGTSKWPLGVFRLSQVPVEDQGSPTLSLTAYDYSRTVSRNRLTAPWIVTAGTNYGAAIAGLVSNRLPGTRVRPHSVAATTPLLVVDPEEDPWKVVTDWATSCGQEVYFDAEGWLVIAPEPDPEQGLPTWTYTDGADSVIVSAGKTMSDEPGYNGVVLTSESTTLATPLRAEVWDADPASPTYHLGVYGKVPKFVSSPYVATQAQADAAALAEYRRSAGGTEQLSLTIVPNPLHQVGDIIRVVRPLSKIDQTTVVDSMTVPLGPGSGGMTLGCRARRTQ